MISVEAKRSKRLGARQAGDEKKEGAHGCHSMKQRWWWRLVQRIKIYNGMSIHFNMFGCVLTEHTDKHTDSFRVMLGTRVTDIFLGQFIRHETCCRRDRKHNTSFYFLSSNFPFFFAALQRHNFFFISLKMKVPMIALVALTASTNAFLMQSQRSSVSRQYKTTIYDGMNVEGMNAADLSPGFVNDGMFGFMAPFLEVAGMKTGNKIIYGVLTTKVETEMTIDDRREQERIAAKTMVNIGDQERARRDKVGTVVLTVCGIYALWAALIADDGGLYGHFVRFMVLPTFGLGYGYKLSAQTGL